jgi:hypothetical protein
MPYENGSFLALKQGDVKQNTWVTRLSGTALLAGVDNHCQKDYDGGEISRKVSVQDHSFLV